MEFIARAFSLLSDVLFPPKDTGLLVRCARTDALHSLVVPRLRVLQELEVTALLPYRNSLVRAFIVEAKFKGNKTAQRALGVILHDYLESLIQEANEFEETFFRLVPIPLSHAREKARGYNQTLEIAKYAVEGLRNIEIAADLLQKVRDTAPQTSLNRSERIHNMYEAFISPHPPDSSYTYIIFDDVSTTGSTLLAAQQVLMTQKGLKIQSIALAH